MRSMFLLAAVSLLAFLSAVANAACSCSEADTVCLQKCVSDANNCIQNCQGSNDCYTNCVEQYWPTSVLPASSAVISTSMPTTATASASASSHSASQTQSATQTPQSSAPSTTMARGSTSVALMFAVIMMTIFYL